MKNRSLWVLVILTLGSMACAADRPPIPVDDVASAAQALESERVKVQTATDISIPKQARRMLDLGLWEEAESLLASAEETEPVLQALVELRIKQHRYGEAAAHLEGLLAAAPEDRDNRLLKARLEIQAWDLEAAAAITLALLEEDRRDEAAALLLGRIKLLEKDYDEAAHWADQVKRWNRRNAGAHLLEADVRFWAQDPAGAEPALVRALELDPFNPDARFSYGYAIWRRVDATQLDAMAAQWELALEIDPLHYITHWHWGNGHTNLTYADYAHPSDSIVQDRLEPVRESIAQSRLDVALKMTRALDREFPESILPALLRGSAFYMAYQMDLDTRLDSAQATFAAILDRKAHYGPAHNGLAAVIKQRQTLYLGSNDSLEAVIATTPLPNDPTFDAVFQDLRQYPGTRVQQMVRRQLGPAIAYLPMLHRLGRTFSIPPLHVDLAEAMGSPRLRTSTTFDNRQWMDIRGVGSGATGLEYVERGAHWERNVTSHEYVHLFHGQVLTDAENRQVRDLYHRAMEEGRTLDYYASNNESEFFAQAYEAYISPVKVHPLNHKALNTRADLERKDPATFAFVESLVRREEAYLAGDEEGVRSNWAQVYTSLSERARRGGTAGGMGRVASTTGRPALDLAAGAALLDSALVWDDAYLPAYLSYAALYRDARRFQDAERWLLQAEELDATYAPIYSARAEVVRARAEVGGEDAEAAVAAVAEQVALYLRSLELEQDLSVRNRLNVALRNLYRDNALISEAIQVADEYLESAPVISTYLRDRRDDAAAFAHALRSASGYAESTLPFFEAIVAQKPQNYELRKEYAAALMAAGRLNEAVATLEEAQRILHSAGNARPDYMVQIAEIHLLRGDGEAARSALQPVLDGRARVAASNPQLLRVLASLGEDRRVQQGIAALPIGKTPVAIAETAFTRGWIAEIASDQSGAVQAYREAVTADPYHRVARARLAGLLLLTGNDSAAAELIDEADSLPLPLGPDFQRELDAVTTALRAAAPEI